MTTLAQRAALSGPSNGGVAARRAVVRWGTRMFRREWRQQLLVVALLTVAVSAAIGSITFAWNSGAADNTDFGSANQLLQFDGTDPQKLEAGLRDARTAFGTIDVIAHRSVTVPGAVERLDYRAQDPGGVYGGELLALIRGSYPQGPVEVAVTNGVAGSLQLGLGSTLALDGHRRKVVGIVENPSKLSDEFALVAPSTLTPDHVDVLVAANGDPGGFFASKGAGPRGALVGNMIRGNDNAGANTLAMFSAATVFVLLASLVAAAGFAVVAQRRLRQLGMLAAVGATQKHLRLVLLTNGVLVGAIAAFVGTIIGLALWVAFAPTLESAVDHRIDRLSLPWELIAMTVVLALLGATAASWWPGRAVARLPVMLALSGRPPKPRPARRFAVAAGTLLVVGIGALAFSNRDRPPLIVVGLVATILGSLLIGPLAIRTFTAAAGRVPVAPRLALRDLARYQARSGAALAAVTLALGLAVAAVIVASAEEAKRGNKPPALSDRQIRVYLGPSEARGFTPVGTNARLSALGDSVSRLAAQLDRPTVVPLRKVVQPGAAPFMMGRTRVYPSIELTRRQNTSSGRHYTPQGPLFVATPAALRYLGIDRASIDSSTDFLADRSLATDQLVIPSFTSRKEFKVAHVQRFDLRRRLFGTDSAEEPKPPTLITLDGLRRLGWMPIPAGWLIESNRPLTDSQITVARDRAAQAGLSIETQGEHYSLATAKMIWTAVGAFLALAILALSVGLIRSESAGDLRTLTATGATARVRRTLTATTAGALALLGAVLGAAGAYVVLVALYHDDLGYLGDVPFAYLTLAVVGVPLAAAGAGWILAGREPPAVARTVLE